MFANACRMAKNFTRPVATSVRLQDGTLETTLSTFIVVNRDGWAITAGHLLDSFFKYNEDLKKINEVKKINGDNPDSKAKTDPKTIVNHSFWWGWDGVTIKECTVDRKTDIALVKLANFNPNLITSYPVFSDQADISVGMSVCRLGYPFMDPKSDFDKVSGNFRISKVDHDSALFVNDGVVSKICYVSGKDRSLPLYVDVSTPGYRGQDGGPVIDSEGRVCAMQVNTLALPFGYESILKGTENPLKDQFCFIGRGVHANFIRNMLDSRNISYSKDSGDEEYKIVG